MRPFALVLVGFMLGSWCNGPEARVRGHASGVWTRQILGLPSTERTMNHFTDAQLDRIRQTIEPTVNDWRTDYDIPEGKEHGQLVNRIVAAIAAMHQSGVLMINNEAGRPEGGV